MVVGKPGLKKAFLECIKLLFGAQGNCPFKSPVVALERGKALDGRRVYLFDDTRRLEIATKLERVIVTQALINVHGNSLNIIVAGAHEQVRGCIVLFKGAL